MTSARRGAVLAKTIEPPKGNAGRAKQKALGVLPIDAVLHPPPGIGTIARASCGVEDGGLKKPSYRTS